MTRFPFMPVRRAAWPLAALALWLAAGAGFDATPAHALNPRTPATVAWPPVWPDTPPAVADDGPPAFQPPVAADCRRLPTTHEVPGRAVGQGRGDPEAEDSDRRAEPSRRERMKSAPAYAASPALARDALPAPATAAAEAAPAGAAPRRPPPAQRPAHEPVTAGVVDDNADFGAYLAYRQRQSGLPVRARDVSERHLLQAFDPRGRPVADAEVAVQLRGAAAPVMWARSDAAGRVWLHPKAFLPANGTDTEVLGVAVRKGSLTGQTLLRRDQKHAVEVRLGAQPAAARPRLDLVFLVDATGSMSDEIAKLKRSMRSMADQIAQLPGQPDICWGLVAYRDHGDAFLTRRHGFTNDLGAFQQVLADVQAGGGGDTPEALDEALAETVHGLAWRADATRLVVLVADAPPHTDRDCPPSLSQAQTQGQAQGQARAPTCPRYDREMQAALAKGIKLFAVGASGLDPVGEYVFRQLAQYTGGRFVFLTYRDAADPSSGPGTQTAHDVANYSVQTLDALVVRLVGEELAQLRRGG